MIVAAVFQHSVVNGELDARTVISATICPGFRARVDPADSVLLKTYEYKYKIREVLFLKNQKLLVEGKVWIPNRFFNLINLTCLCKIDLLLRLVYHVSRERP
jgi:hypothetical protein